MAKEIKVFRKADDKGRFHLPIREMEKAGFDSTPYRNRKVEITITDKEIIVRGV